MMGYIRQKQNVMTAGKLSFKNVPFNDLDARSLGLASQSLPRDGAG
jgi:hypothetical protein